MLAAFGSILGVLTAIGIYVFFRRFREPITKAVAVIGAIITLLCILAIGTFTSAYLVMRNDPSASMGQFWGMLALMLSVLLVVSGGIACVHCRKLHMSWFDAFGIIMAEVGVAIFASMLAHQMQYEIADSFRNGNSIKQILDSFDSARELLGYFDLALVCALVLLEISGPFFRIRTPPIQFHKGIV